MRKTKTWPAKDRIFSVLIYCPETGIFRWKIRMSSRAAEGDVAGTADPRGYRQIRIDGVVMREHRLAWLFVHGEFPEKQIDHIDGDPSNNRINNLRLADGYENHQNEGLSKNNRSGHTGVRRHAGKWVAGLMVHGKAIHLGRFERFEDAVEARRAAKLVHHYFQPVDRCDLERLALHKAALVAQSCRHG